MQVSQRYCFFRLWPFSSQGVTLPFDLLCGVLVSMSDYQEIPGSVSGYALEIVLERGAPSLVRTILGTYLIHHHQSVLPKGRFFTANSGTKAAVLPKGRYSIAKSGTKVTVLLGMNRCDSFPLLSAPLSLASEQTLKDLTRPQGLQRKWIWLTGSSGRNRNSLQGLISVPSGFLTRSEIRKSQSPLHCYLTAITSVGLCYSQQ